jgi:hypothetical protein
MTAPVKEWTSAELVFEKESLENSGNNPLLLKEINAEILTRNEVLIDAGMDCLIDADED